MNHTELDKARLREYLKQQRNGLTQAQRLAFNQAIRQAALQRTEAADTVFCYVSTAQEVDTRDIIEQLWRQNKTVLVPRLLARQRMIAVRCDGWEQLRAGELGILTPATDTEWNATVDLCITPGLGFNVAGQRIGYGRGYYDRWFSTHPHCARIALCHECQIVEHIPITETDLPVQTIITEQRVIACCPSTQPAQNR